MILIRDIHRLLRHLQVKYRRVRKASEFAVSIAEVHVMVELDAAEALSVSQLSEALLITQSQVTRVLQGLRARHLIVQKTDSVDARKVVSRLSADGRAMVVRIDLVMGEIFNVSAQSINRLEQRELTQLFELVARGHGCNVIRVRPGESRLRAAHRQMARIFGLLRNNVYDSEMTRAQWSVFETIIRAPEAVSANIIEGYLGIKTTLISEILTSFEAHGLVERIRSAENHRVYLLYPTALGRRKFRRLETRAVIRLKDCLKRYSQVELARIHEIIRKFAGEWGQDSIFLGQSFQTRLISDSSELRSARAFAMRSLVAHGWEHAAPDPMVPKDHQVWGLFERKTEPPCLRALCVARPEKARWTVCLAVSDRELKHNQLNAFVQYSHFLGNRGKKALPLEIDFPPFTL